MSGDWKIGDDRRRRSTDQIRAFQRANDGEVAWDTLAPADFTFVFHPDRVLVGVEDVEAFLGNLDRQYDVVQARRGGG